MSVSACECLACCLAKSVHRQVCALACITVLALMFVCFPFLRAVALQVTAAIGAEQFYGSATNPRRSEGLEGARAIDEVRSVVCMQMWAWDSRVLTVVVAVVGGLRVLTFVVAR